MSKGLKVVIFATMALGAVARVIDHAATLAAIDAFIAGLWLASALEGERK